MPLFGRDAQGLTESEGRELLAAILWWSVGTTSVASVVGAIAAGQIAWLPFMLAPVPFQVLAVFALRRFPVRSVAAAYFALVSTFFFIGALADRGTAGQAYYGLVMVVQCTALLFGTRGTLFLAPALLAMGGALAVLETKGLLLPPPSRGPFVALVAPLSAFVLTAAGSIVIHRRLKRAVGQAQAQALFTAKANTQLSHEIDRRVQMEGELHASMERALEASRLKSSFLANVSHELRTPMNAVVGLTDLLLRDGPTASQREALETIRSSSDALLSLLDDILDLSKIESGVMQFEPLPTSASSVAEEVRKLLSARAQARGIGLRCEVSPETPTSVVTDPTRLRQVLLNLVGNAIKFTASGEVVMRVSWAAERLSVSVSDTGIGISKEQLGRIFQPFVQADASTTRRFGGTGLGLTIVQRLVEAQGGSVTATSTEGRGSVFTVELPAAVAKARPLVGSSSGNLPTMTDVDLSALKVLLAEDNPINEKVALKLLEHLGVRADVARNGLEAVELATRGGYDVVLMDIQMPELDGIAATERVRAQIGGGVRIVAMTANAMPEDKARAREAGCDDFLAKPVRLEDLQRALVRALSSRRAA